MSDTLTKPTSAFYKALLKAQQALGAVRKDGTGQYGSKPYTTIEQMIESANEVLHPHGLLLIGKSGEIVKTGESVEEVINARTGEVSGQRQSPTYKWSFEALLVHADTGEELLITREAPIMPQKGRALDIATAAADSFNLLYMLRDALMAKRGDEEAKELRPEPQVSQAEREQRITKAKETLPQRQQQIQEAVDLEKQLRDEEAKRIAANKAQLEAAAKATASTTRKLQEEERVQQAALILAGKVSPEITKVLQVGGTPTNVPGFYDGGWLPEDPTHEILHENGWTFSEPTAEELAAFGQNDPLPPPVKQHLVNTVVRVLGKVEAKSIFAMCGSVSGGTLNGYQGRLIALIAGNKAQAQAELPF